MVKSFTQARIRGTLEADLNWYTATDPWGENKHIPETMNKMEIATTKIKKYLNYIKHYIEEQQFIDLKRELREFEWDWKILNGTKIEKAMRPKGIRIDRDAAINLTDIQIPEDTEMVAAWGKKFAFPTDIWDDINFITEVDTMIENKMPTVLWQEAKKRSSIMMDRHKKERNRNITKSWLNFISQRAADFFKKHQQLIISQSDKGKHSVIMYREEYEKKIMDLLNDTTTYTPTEINLEEIIQKNDALVDKLIEISTIKRENRGRMSDRGTIPAKFYGLPKIHKTGTQLRPITSAINSPGKKLASLMVEILTPLFTNDDLHVRNSNICKDKLRDIELDPDEMLVSFDVTSMYTNISTKLAIDIIGKRKSLIEGRTKIPFDILTRILNFLLNECAFFTYNNITYTQSSGLPMGSPESPLIANILMTDLIETQRPKFTREPEFIFVYVDDTIGAIHKNHIEQTLETLNAYNDEINFTMEIEIGKRINFLDITIIREGNRMTTKWFKKPYASDRLLNY